MSFSGTKGYITKPKPGVMINPLHPLSKGLVGYWLFNEGVGSKVYDISGRGNHGSFVNIGPSAWVGGIRGSGLLVDDTDLSKIVLDSPLLTDFSIITICRPDNISDINTVACQYDGTLMLYTRDVIKLWYSSTSHAANTSLVAGTGYTIGFTSRSGDGTFYLDGLPDGTCENVTGFTLDTLLNNTWDNGFTGIMSSIMIYSRGLSAWEMKQLDHNPFCNLLQVPIRRYFDVAPPVGVSPTAIFYGPLVGPLGGPI